MLTILLICGSYLVLGFIVLTHYVQTTIFREGFEGLKRRKVSIILGGEKSIMLKIQKGGNG